ncbi:thermonuclease family protein [Roseibium aggregatum]|uniref:Thermonuclease family protein n=1 Tax=Roseibium aggregatum TaxID=187304 RepID=A0A939ECF8_9HYPH|nr:thermonuclease family protein [Roseibium aggregatum]MBN9669325.1 thermonuclease family protein [Roseibium aggregatum]
MKLRPIIVPVILLTAAGGLLAWLLLAEPPQIPEDGKPASAVEASAPATGAVSAEDLRTEEIAGAEHPVPAAPLPQEIRDVSPDGVTSPRVTGNLKRIEPSKRYLELKDPPVEPVPDGPLELTRVQVLDNGHLRSGKLTVTLAYIEPLDPEATCVTRTGETWPCGARARTFLRGLVRQFKITCHKMEETGPQQILATCKRGLVDLSARLIRYGWAAPSTDAPSNFQDLALKAREKKIGQWKTEWLSELPGRDWESSATAALPGLEGLTQEVVEWSLSASEDQPGEPVLSPDAGFPLLSTPQ